MRPHLNFRAGAGKLAIEQIGGRSVVTGARASSPLKLLTPGRRTPAAWAFSSTYGGGLLAGDAISLDVRIGPHARCFVGTQSATKVYRSPAGHDSSQAVNVSLADGSLGVIVPHPISCFANARFVQRQRIELTGTASLVLVDWLTSGRHAAGERWAFELYDSRTDVVVDGRRLLRDALRLSAHDGAISGYHRTGGYDCFAYAVVLGPAVREGGRHAMEAIGRESVLSAVPQPLLFSASPLEGGVILRAAGTGAEVVGRWLAEHLAFVGRLLGDDRWAGLALV